MLIEIDFNSDEAIYLQLRNQIILQIANETLKDGVSLPSVRQLADSLGVNMHTVNKAYSILRQEGYLKVDRRHGAIIAIEVDRYKAQLELVEELKISLAKAISRGISREEAKDMVDRIYDIYLGSK